MAATRCGMLKIVVPEGVVVGVGVEVGVEAALVPSGVEVDMFWCVKPSRQLGHQVRVMLLA